MGVHNPSQVAGGAGSLTSGGTEGNEQLTAVTGLVLFVGLAVLGLTIVQIGQLLWLHLFLGLLLIGPVALKMASTGYRFFRYYTGSPPYARKGPPAPALRVLAPLVVGLTVIVFASGVALLLIGPDSTLRSDVFLIHKVSFIAWVVFTVVHVVGHLPEVLRLLRIGRGSRAEMLSLRIGQPVGPVRAPEPPVTEPIAGGAGRWLSLGTSVIVGLVLAVALLPQFSPWTANGSAAVHHHHHDH